MRSPAHPTDPNHFHDSAVAALLDGVVQFGTQVDVPSDAVTSRSSGLLDFRDRRAQFSVQTLMDSQLQGEPVPTCVSDGVLSLGTRDSSGSLEWINTELGSLAELGIFPLLWSRGAQAHDAHFSLDQDRMLNGADEAVSALLEQSLDLLGWRSPAVPLRGQFEVLGEWWWSRIWSPRDAARNESPVLTVTMARAAAGTQIAIPEELLGRPVVTPEVVVRLLAHDWPGDLSWRP